ncbi:hypothetical protein CDD83_10857 [Cordyceps sp. RAO-2017]|nr:hypothetical protein CDD83_10857 [Cordyceps sp. RAO-2017]
MACRCTTYTIVSPPGRPPRRGRRTAQLKTLEAPPSSHLVQDLESCLAGPVIASPCVPVSQAPMPSAGWAFLAAYRPPAAVSGTNALPVGVDARRLLTSPFCSPIHRQHCAAIRHSLLLSLPDRPAPSAAVGNRARSPRWREGFVLGGAENPRARKSRVLSALSHSPSDSAMASFFPHPSEVLAITRRNHLSSTCPADRLARGGEMSCSRLKADIIGLLRNGNGTPGRTPPHPLKLAERGFCALLHHPVEPSIYHVSFRRRRCSPFIPARTRGQNRQNLAAHSLAPIARVSLCQVARPTLDAVAPAGEAIHLSSILASTART